MVDTAGNLSCAAAAGNLHVCFHIFGLSVKCLAGGLQFGAPPFIQTLQTTSSHSFNFLLMQLLPSSVVYSVYLLQSFALWFGAKWLL
eukprot:scaffold102960_cov41-Prasinocladus_malaysianus.AAC.1